jgi:cytoskeletal protein RodZ
MENFDKFPERRIFHIDNECYIIYIGKDKQDLRPFLRIGTSDRIPKQVLSDIYTVIVPDSLTGNPLYEVRNESVREYRYIGDSEIIQHFKKFLQIFKTKPKAIEDYKHVKSDGNRVLVYFMDNKNINIAYNNEVIFDLKKRELQDKHFNQRADIMKDHIKRDPLLLPFHKIDQAGFIVLDETTILFKNSNLVSDKVLVDYFREAAKYGIDPDLLQGAVTSRLNEGLLRFLKRKKYSDSRAVLFSKNKKKIQDFTTLFPSAKAGMFQVTVHQLNNTKGVTSGKFSYKLGDDEQGNKIIIDNEDFPRPIMLSDENVNGKNNDLIIIDSKDKTVSLKERLNIFTGIPYVPIKSKINTDTVIKEFVIESGKKFKKFMSSTDIPTVDIFINYFNDLISGNKTRDDAVSIKLSQISGNMDPVLIALFNNICSASILLSETRDDQLLNNISSELSSILNTKRLGSSDIPLLGELYQKEGKILCFYTLLIEGLSASDIQASKKARRYISELPEGDNSFYFSERERLIRLSRELEPPRTAKIREQRIPGTSESVKETQSRFSEEKEQAQAPSKLKPKEEITPVHATQETGAIKRKQKRFPVKFFTVASIVALILFTGFLTWWFGFRGNGKQGDDVSGGDADIVAQADNSNSGLDKTSKEKNSQTEQDQDSTNGQAQNGRETVEKTEQETTEKPDNNSVTVESEEKDSADSQNTDISPDTTQDEKVPEADIPNSFFETPRMKELRKIDYTSESGENYDFEITISDIIRTTNTISDLNGYRKLGTENRPGVKDSHWIYPGDILIMPEGDEYRISRGDTIWHVAAGYIQSRTIEDLKQYSEIINSMDEQQEEEIKKELRKLANNSYSSQFRRLVENKIQSL